MIDRVQVGTDIKEFLLDGGDAINGSNRIIIVDLRKDLSISVKSCLKGQLQASNFVVQTSYIHLIGNLMT